jgi:hypothetical protein
MTTDYFCFYLQNRLIQTSQTGGQRYSDTSPFSIPWVNTCLINLGSRVRVLLVPAERKWEERKKSFKMYFAIWFSSNAELMCTIGNDILKGKRKSQPQLSQTFAI